MIQADSFKDRSVLVTGGTGTLGRALIDALLETPVRRIIVFSRDEYKQWQLETRMTDPRLRYFLGDVRDRERLRRALAGVQDVIHTAAMKHVSAAEFNPFECVQTNILGVQNLIEAAIDRGVERVLGVSTDKASNPASLYGATKLVGDRLLIDGNAYAGGGVTRLAVIRFGNLANSRGSIVELIREGHFTGPIPITDPRVTRFWISPADAAQWTLRTLSDMRGGEIVVPKLPSLRLPDLIEAVAPGRETKVVGLREGEKLHEELIGEPDASRTVDYGDYLVIHSGQLRSVEGEKAAEGFSYTSDRNEMWLSLDQIRASISQSTA